MKHYDRLLGKKAKSTDLHKRKNTEDEKKMNLKRPKTSPNEIQEKSTIQDKKESTGFEKADSITKDVTTTDQTKIVFETFWKALTKPSEKRGKNIAKVSFKKLI